MKKTSENQRVLFVEGPVDPLQITEWIKQNANDKRAGGCQFFLGQVRDDEIEGKRVRAIEYTCYKKMALKEYELLKKQIFNAYPIRNLQVLHSLGTVKAGEISLFVMVTAEHREEALDACRETINLIKKRLPVWGKEILDDEHYTWKENKNIGND